MNSLDKIFTEEQAVEIAEKILSATKKKILDQIADKFYDESENYLGDIYINAKDKIERDLISEITEQFVTDPSQYKFKNLRDKL